MRTTTFVLAVFILAGLVFWGVLSLLLHLAEPSMVP